MAKDNLVDKHLRIVDVYRQYDAIRTISYYLRGRGAGGVAPARATAAGVFASQEVIPESTREGLRGFLRWTASIQKILY